MVQFTTNDPSSPSLLILQSPQSSHNHHHHYCHVTITSFRQFWTRFWQQLQHVFPFRSRKNKLRVIQVVNRSYPNFKPSNPKSQPAWLVGPPLVSTSLPPFRLNQKKTSWFFQAEKLRYFLPKFSWGAFTSGDSPSLRRRLLNSVNRTAPGEFGGSVMMDYWWKVRWWRGGAMIKGKKGGMGEKSWGMMMEFQSGFARDI